MLSRSPSSRPADRFRAPTRRSRDSGLFAAVLLIAILAVVPWGAARASLPPTDRAAPGAGVAHPHGGPYENYSLIDYNTSTLPIELSYYEWLPAGYSSSRTYPLVVLLHGIQGEGPSWTVTGIKSEVVSDIQNNTQDGAALRALLNASIADGYLLITINERTGSGWYANSVCGGPQENDTLDAIAYEESLRHVGRVYLLGFSMGATGAFALAATHPGMFSGIAAAGTITDAYQAMAYRLTNQHSTDANYTWANMSYHTMVGFTCGHPPDLANATTDAVYDYLSVARLDPYALATTPLYVVSGGADNRAPDDGIGNPFYQTNNTFVNSTCLVALDEPASCTIPFAALHNSTPSEYAFREIYEPSATGSYAQWNASDVFGWFNGAEPSGFYIAHGWPPTAVVPTVPQNLQLTGPGPAVTASSSATVGLVGTAFNFSANASGPGGPPYSFTWNFGDGASSSGAYVQHVYTAPGNYTVTVTVPGNAGNRTTDVLPTLHIEGPLAAKISVAPSPPSATRSATVTANVTGGSGGYTCRWNFGDTRTGSGCATTHVWAAGGTFFVAVTVSDSLGHFANFSTNVTVNGTATSPTPVSTSPARSLPPNSLEGGAIVVGVAVLVVLLLRWRRRRKPAADPGPAVSGAAPGTATPPPR